MVQNVIHHHSFNKIQKHETGSSRVSLGGKPDVLNERGVNILKYIG